MELNVHLVEGFLHVLNVDRCHLHEALSVPPKGSDGADILGRTMGGAEKANGMKILQPLTIGDIGLATGYVLHVTLTRQTRKPRSSSSWNSGIQKTPVDSIATLWIPHCSSQSASFSSCLVKVAKRRPGRGSRSPATAT